MTVYKLDENGQEVWQYPATLLQRSDTSVQLEAFFNREDTDLGCITFHQGDRFIEYFFTDRWYNIFAIYDAESELFRGWYCNICRPATINERTIRCDDLALDLWVAPDGATTVLDEEEFAGLDLPAGERLAAEAALSHLVQIAKRGALPY